MGNGAFTVGFLSGGYGYFAGQISTVRVSSSAVYTGNFTVPTIPFLANDNIATTSASFNGTNQQLSVPANAGFNFGTGDFTIECWMYATSLKLCDLYLQFPDVSAYFFFGLANVSGAMRFNYNNGAIYDPFGVVTTANSLISINTWYHVALMRSGNTISLFINGVCRGTRSGVSATAMGGSSAGVTIAGGGNNFPGRLSNMRVVKGSTFYTYGTTVGTTYFTPPTTPLTAVAGTQLLLPLTTTPFTDISTNALAVTNTNNVTTANTPVTNTQFFAALGVSPFVDSSTNAITVTNTGTVVPAVQYPFTSTDATGTYTITRTNAGSITYSSSNGGSFAKSNNVGTDFIYGGPNYVIGQSYTVFMAYKLSATSSGRLLNTQDESSRDWMLGAYNGYPDAFFPNTTVNLPTGGADTVWHFAWGTWNNSTSTGQLYTATSGAPTDYSYTATAGNGGGFNQLRMFSRSSGSEVQTGNIAFVKVYDRVLTLTEIQTLHGLYKSRFGY
jgi:hypothetical protein